MKLSNSGTTGATAQLMAIEQVEHSDFWIYRWEDGLRRFTTVYRGDKVLPRLWQGWPSIDKLLSNVQPKAEPKPKPAIAELWGSWWSGL